MNGLVDSGDEGRGKQRYASGSRKQALIRRCPNGETHLASSRDILHRIHRCRKQDGAN